MFKGWGRKLVKAVRLRVALLSMECKRANAGAGISTGRQAACEASR